jgi:hypothetical protein
MISNSSLAKFIIVVLRSPPISCRRRSLDPTPDRFAIQTEDKRRYFETFASLRRGFDILIRSFNLNRLVSLSLEQRTFLMIEPKRIDGSCE